MLEERPRGGERVGPARAYGDYPVVGCDQLAASREEKLVLLVGYDEHRFEPSEGPVHAPLLDQLDGRTLQVAAILFELRLEPVEERERVGDAAGETGKDLVVVELPHFSRSGLQDGAPESDLSVRAHRHFSVLADAQDRRSPEFGHVILP